MDVFSSTQHPVPVVRPTKLANIHSDLKSAQKNGFAATSLLVPRFSSRKKDRVAMCYHFGLDGALMRHDIEMKAADAAPSQLSASVVAKYKWDLNRTTKSWPEVRYRAAPSPGSASSASVQPNAAPQIDFAAGFGSADQEALVAKQLLANAEIETSDSKTADKPFWQSPVFRLVAWTELSHGLQNDVANFRPSEDDPSIRSGRKADLLIQNDSSYARTPSRLIPRPRLDSGPENEGLVQKFAAASAPMSSGRRASGPAQQFIPGPPINVFDGVLDDDDLEESGALQDKRLQARAAVVAAPMAAPAKEPVLKPHIVVQPAVAAPQPAPKQPAPVPVEPAAHPQHQAQLNAPISNKKKKNRKGKAKIDSSGASTDEENESGSSRKSSGSEQDVSQSAFLLQDALN